MHEDRHIRFGGDTIPAKIASDPKIIRPARKMTSTPIAGTNRENIQMEDAWETYDQPYSLYLGDGSEDSIQEAIQTVAEKLFKTGWQVLEDDYEPDIFRLAYYKGPFEVENRYTRIGKFDITFRCRPERFLKTGDTPVSVASGESLPNPTAQTAKPLIHIEGSGSGNLTVGDTTMAFTGLVDYLNIDCDTMNVYRLASENRNSLMTGEFPVLKSGQNPITFTGGITSVTITPRFWVI